MIACKSAKKIFMSAVSAVQPEQLVSAILIKDQDICGQAFVKLNGTNCHHALNCNVYVVGFGKAVAGMCRVVQTILGEHIVAGALSVPTGLFHDFSAQHKQNLLPLCDGKIAVYEGASYNMPDEQSCFAAGKIIELCQNAGENDLIIALVSGGGSALLPAPIHPLTLEEKLGVIKLLVNKGATIQELNTVRKNLSAVKGGRLAEIAKPAKLWGLILSDIIGDPIELIASGPTVPTRDHPDDAIDVINKYGLQNDLVKVCSILKALPAKKISSEHIANNRIINTIIGNNTTSIEKAMDLGFECGYKSITLSRGLCGEARLLGNAFAELCVLLLKNFKKTQNLYSQLHKNFQNHGLTSEDTDLFCSNILRNQDKPFKLCIISGGETTVTLSSKPGLGGRNQEMVLSFAIQYDQLHTTLKDLNLQELSVTFLSGGTDGQDGPTTAAGAIFSSENLQKFDSKLAKQCLKENNSNYFFKKCGGLLEIGLTGTNVMDIQILLIELRS